MVNKFTDIKVCLGSRSSPLALQQVELAISHLHTSIPNLQFKIKTFTTTGDKNQSDLLRTLGGKGVFCAEVDRACLDQEIDISVHSAKDMAAEIPPDLTIAAVLKRAVPFDVLISKENWTLETLPEGARIGTSSLRRQVLLKYHRPDLEISNIRGNVETRLQKIEDGQYHATLLAAAGLQRLGLPHHLKSPLGLDTFPPAVGQGIIALVMHKKNPILPLVQASSDKIAKLALLTERAFLWALEGSCQMPIAGHAKIMKDGTIHLNGMLGCEKTSRVVFGSLSGDDPHLLGKKLAQILRDKL